MIVLIGLALYGAVGMAIAGAFVLSGITRARRPRLRCRAGHDTSAARRRLRSRTVRLARFQGSFGSYPALWCPNVAGVLTTAEYHQNGEEK